MKQILIILILSWFCTTVFSQNQDWEIYIGSSNQSETPYELIQTYDNGLFIIGNLKSEGYVKGWDIKTDVNGNILWDKVLSYEINDIGGWAVTTDDSGNRYECGTFWSEIIGIWPYTAKFDSCGQKLWCKIMKDDVFNFGYSVSIIINENQEIAVLTNYTNLNNLADRIFILGFDINGNFLWKKPYASQNNHPWIKDPVGYCLKEFKKEYYISGWCYWPYPDDTTHFFLRPFFVGIDSIFNEKWILPFYALDSIFGDAYSLTQP